MRTWRSALGLITSIGAALGVAAQSASAEDAKFGYSWTISGANDYIFRGISFTQNDPTVNSYLEFTYGIGYLAFFTTNIDTCDFDGCLGSIEQDIYLGIRPVTGPINWDIAAWYYLYDTKGKTLSTFDVDYFEFKVGATTSPTTDLTLGVNLYYQPDQGLAAVENFGAEGTIAYTLPKVGIFTPTVSGLLGFADSGKSTYFPDGFWIADDSYTYWNAGVKFAIDHVTFDFRYWGTDLDSAIPANNNLADDRFITTISFTMP